MASYYNMEKKNRVVRPLKASHAIVKRTEQPDQFKIEKVASLCRDLDLVTVSHLQTPKLIETLSTPSERRFQTLCGALFFIGPELEGELEELKPEKKKSLEETRYRYVMEFCHDVGIFDDGDEVDLKKIKGDLSLEDHLRFWESLLKLAQQMRDHVGPRDITLENLDMENFTAMVDAFGKFVSITESPTLLSEPLMEQLRKESSAASYSLADLKGLEMSANDKWIKLKQIVDEEEEEESFREKGSEPPAELADETTKMQMKLLLGNVKDLIQTFSVRYDSSVKNLVASCKSIPVVPITELGELFKTASNHQDDLSHFVEDVGIILERLQNLRETHADFYPRAEEIERENAAGLSLDLRSRQA